MSKISPVTQIAIRKNLLFKQTLAEYSKSVPKTSTRNILTTTLSALAILATANIFTNCTKTMLENSSTIKSSEADTLLNTHFKALGLTLNNNSFDKIQNCGFTDNNNYRHLLVPLTSTQDAYKVQHLKLNPKGLLIDASDLIITTENNFLNIERYRYNGDFLGTTKYELLNNKIIEYIDTDGIFVTNSEFYKTQNGFEQKFADGKIKEFKDIKNNENVPDIHIIYDDSLNVITHEIVLEF